MPADACGQLQIQKSFYILQLIKHRNRLRVALAKFPDSSDCHWRTPSAPVLDGATLHPRGNYFCRPTGEECKTLASLPNPYLPQHCPHLLRAPCRGWQLRIPDRYSTLAVITRPTELFERLAALPSCDLRWHSEQDL